MIRKSDRVPRFLPLNVENREYLHPMSFDALLLASLLALDPRVETEATHVAKDAASVEVHRMWITLDAKPLPKGGVRAALTPLTPRALARRATRRTLDGLVDARDLPIARERSDAILATGAKIRASSRWLNAISVTATRRELDAIARLPFVRAMTPLRRSWPITAVETADVTTEGGVAALDYGFSTTQLTQIGVPSMHLRGFTGAGMVIGVLDTGFHRVHAAFQSVDHPLDVIAEWDFVSNDGNTGIDIGDHPEQHKHGTWILGTMAAYLPGSVIGAAYDAKFVLAKTEVYETETVIEEDYYVAGLEFIEAQGADLATSSLGYIDWYLPADLDGATAITTQAVNIATANGLVCLTAAGNAGHDADITTQHLIAPADAFEVITCGAVGSDPAATASFSSDGPTADGRIKPEVLARGVGTVTVHSTNATGLQGVSGTSLSTPLVAGATALLMQARPDLNVSGVRHALFSTASEMQSNGFPDLLFVRGYGVISLLDAARTNRAAEDLDLNGAVGASDLAQLLAVWGLCADPDPATGTCPADFDGDGLIGAADLSRLLATWGT